MKDLEVDFSLGHTVYCPICGNKDLSSNFVYDPVNKVFCHDTHIDEESPWEYYQPSTEITTPSFVTAPFYTPDNNSPTDTRWGYEGEIRWGEEGPDGKWGIN